jgi:hypothetical protein
MSHRKVTNTQTRVASAPEKWIMTEEAAATCKCRNCLQLPSPNQNVAVHLKAYRHPKRASKATNAQGFAAAGCASGGSTPAAAFAASCQ